MAEVLSMFFQPSKKFSIKEMARLLFELVGALKSVLKWVEGHWPKEVSGLRCFGVRDPSK
jgi:hypothetical protein